MTNMRYGHIQLLESPIPPLSQKNVTKKRCVSAWPKISATKEFPLFFLINSNQKSRVKYHLGNEGAEQAAWQKSSSKIKSR